MFTELPEKVETQAGWEYEMAIAAMEGGLPTDFIAEHLQAALKLEPDLGIRPVIAYYLGKLGKEVPPPRARAATPSPALSPPTGPASTATDRPELPADLFTPGEPAPVLTPTPAPPANAEPLPRYVPPKP